MKVIVKDIKVPVVKKDIKEDIKRKLKDTLKVPSSRIIDFRIVKQSIDARKPRDMVYWVFSVLVEVKGNIQLSEKVVPYDEPTLDFKLIKKKLVPVIVGAGPCGLFSALFLSYHGINGIVVERGCSIDERIAKVEKLWNEGILDIDCNPQFGEGGAGTFSDGKLVTRVKDPLIGFVLREFVRFGAHEKILIDSKPHVGTEYIRKIVKNIRDYLISKGWSFRFKEKVVDMETTNTRVKAVITEKGKIEGTHFIFAIGNSARDTFEMLLKQNVAITGKPFAIGFRVEHPQDLINENQYGRFKKFLPPASYTLTYNFKEDSRGVYSFCMCPGGYIICGSSEENTVVTNGMSYFKRDSSFANSAIVITVDKRDFPNAGPLGGVELQRILESKAFVQWAPYYAPAQKIIDFIKERETKGYIESTYKPGVYNRNLKDILPEDLIPYFKKALLEFDKKIRGFISEGVIVAPETRTSSPVRIIRDPYKLCSVTYNNLYPAGEGSGYAGGIISSVLDGIRVVKAIISEVENE